jgi:hypothetical protein
MPEDKKIAAQLVENGRQTLPDLVPQAGRLVITDIDEPQPWPEPTPDIGLIWILIGSRDELNKAAAKRMGDLWRKATQHYPCAAFLFFMFGFDEDPREMWEIPDVAHYVRQWARFAGMDDLDAALHWFGRNSHAYPILQEMIRQRGGIPGIGFLAACGVFGERLRQEAIADGTSIRPCGRSETPSESNLGFTPSAASSGDP